MKRGATLCSTFTFDKLCQIAEYTQLQNQQTKEQTF